jgi:hypothetical protein
MRVKWPRTICIKYSSLSFFLSTKMFYFRRRSGSLNTTLQQTVNASSDIEKGLHMRIFAHSGGVGSGKAGPFSAPQTPQLTQVCESNLQTFVFRPVILCRRSTFHELNLYLGLRSSTDLTRSLRQLSSTRDETFQWLWATLFKNKTFW